MIISPFNLTFNCMAFFFALLLVLAYIFGKKMSVKAKKALVVITCIANIVLFFVYKGFLSVDSEFLAITNADKFNWFSELPLQLCNINMFLIPIGLIFNKKSILGFSFFLAPLGAFFALICPEPAFIGYSILIPRIWGFYLTHFLIFISGLSIGVLGFYRPNIKSLPGILLTFIIISACIFGVNLIMIATVCPNANYFFTVSPGGVSILEAFWSLIPVPFLYLIPAIFILVGYMALVSLAFFVIDRISEKKVKYVEVKPAETSKV